MIALPCRLGEETGVIVPAAVQPAESEMLVLAITFGDEPHTLSIVRSQRFPELDKIWDCRANVPEAVLLALVERECGPFFLALENAVRRQLRLVGFAPPAGSDAPALFLKISDLSFSLTRSETVVAALGVRRNLDLSHETVRSFPLSAETEYAAFSLDSADIASLEPGDALLLPEVGTVPAHLVVDGRFVMDAGGVVPFADDGRCRVVSADPVSLSLGELFDAALVDDGEGAKSKAESLPPATQLRLEKNGETIATGRLDRLGDQAAFIVESLTTTH